MKQSSSSAAPGLRALQLELERLELEAEQAPILRQQRQEDQLLDEALSTSTSLSALSRRNTTSNDSVRTTRISKTNTNNNQAPPRGVLIPERENNLFFPASKMSSLLSPPSKREGANDRRSSNASADKNKNASSSSLEVVDQESGTNEELLTPRRTATFNNNIPTNVNTNNNKTLLSPSSSSVSAATGASSPIIASGINITAKQKQPFEEAMRMQAVANLRRMQLTNDFIEYGAGMAVSRSPSQSRGGGGGAGGGDGTPGEGSNASFSFRTNTEYFHDDNNNKNNNNSALNPIHSISQRRRFEQGPSELHREAGDFVNILGVEEHYSASTGGREMMKNNNANNNNNNNNSTMLMMRNAQSQHKLLSSMSMEKQQQPSQFTSFASPGLSRNPSHQMPPPLLSSTRSTTFVGSGVGGKHNSHQQQHQQQHQSIMTTEGRVQAKRYQAWNSKDTNSLLQSTLGEIEQVNSAMTLREYRRTKPRVINSNNNNNNMMNSINTVRPASAPFVPTSSRNNKDEVGEDPDQNDDMPSSNTPSAKMMMMRNNRKDDDNEREALISTLDDPEEEYDERDGEEVDEATRKRKHQQLINMRYYNDPSLEVKANKRLAELMAREAEERHERSLRHLGADNLEDMMLIDDETVEQQRRSIATSNAARRRALQERLQKQTSEINNNNNNTNNTTTLVPPRILKSSAQENIHDDVLRELALKENISLSDIAIKIADEAFEKQEIERRMMEEKNAENEIKRLSKMKRTAATAASNAAEAVLLVKHQAKLENTRQTIRSELDRCKFLVEELKTQSEQAEDTKKKLQRVFSEAIQKIGRGFLERKIVGEFRNKKKKLSSLSSPVSLSPRAARSTDKTFSSPRELMTGDDGAQDQEEEEQQQQQHLLVSPLQITVSNEHSELMPPPSSSPSSSITSPLREALNEAQKSSLTCGEGKAISPAHHSHSHSNQQQQQIDSFVVSVHNVDEEHNDDDDDDDVEKKNNPIAPQNENNNNVTHSTILERANTAVFQNNNNNTSSERKRQQHERENENKNEDSDNSSSEMLKELLKQRQSLQRLVMLSSNDHDDHNSQERDQSGSNSSSNQRHDSVDQQLRQHSQQQQNLIKMSPSSLFGDTINTVALTNTTMTNRSDDGENNSNNHGNLISLLPTPSSPIAALTASSPNTNNTNNQNNNNNNKATEYLESLVSTQEKIISMLNQRQAASVNTLRSLKESKYSSRKATRAAVVIQSIARMYLARCRFMSMLEERDFADLSVEAALMIQRVWRGSRARVVHRKRQRLKRRFFDVAVAGISSSSAFSIIKNCSAAAIQSIWKCFVARRILHRLRTARTEQDSLRIKDDAARVITAFMRRSLYRQKMESVLNDRMTSFLESGAFAEQREQVIETHFAGMLILRAWQTHVQSKKYQRTISLKKFYRQQQRNMKNNNNGGLFTDIFDDDHNHNIGGPDSQIIPQEQEYAVRKIQRFLTNLQTKKVAFFVMRNDNLPMHFLQSMVPSNSLDLIGKIMERKSEKVSI